MGAKDGRLLAALPQALGGVLAEGLQHGEPAAFGCALAVIVVLDGDEQALAQQRGQALGDGERQVATGVADGLGGGEREAAGEGAEAGEERLFAGREQVVAPADGIAERALAGGQVARRRGGVGGDGKPGVDADQQRGGGEEIHAGRGQLDGERQPIEALADGSHDDGMPRIDPEGRFHLARPVHEERDGRRGQEAVDMRHTGQVGQGQGRHAEPPLTPKAQALAAGGDHLQGGAGCQQVGHHGRGGQQVLEIVQHEQGLPAGEVLREAGRQGTGGLAQSQVAGDGVGRKGGITQRSERNEVHAAREPIQDPPGEGNGQPGLADAARAGEGQEAGASSMRSRRNC